MARAGWSAVLMGVVVLGAPMRACSEGRVLHDWAITSRTPAVGTYLYVNAKSGAEASLVCDPEAEYPDGRGVATVRIAKGSRGAPTDIQLSYTSRTPIATGGKYSVEFRARATAPVTVPIGIITDAPPYGPLGSGKVGPIELTTEWKRCAVTFTAQRDFAGDQPIRTPYLALGGCPDGTTVSVAGVVLLELTPAPPPLPILRGDELLRNPGFEAGLEGWTAQASRIAVAPGQGIANGRACLVTERSARWGTPIQDVRSALAKVGWGYYEIGASVRPLRGGGSAFVVVQLKDARGDHWVTSDTLRLRAGEYTRIRSHRVLSWTGRLMAASIQIQTAGQETGDLLVDDVSLRPLTDLAGKRRGSQARMTADFGARRSFNACLVAESVRRIQAYAIEAFDRGKWKTVFTGGAVMGSPDVLHFAPATGTRARLRVIRSDGKPAVTRFSLYATDSRERTVRVPPPPVDRRKRSARTLVGAIRWDGWCGDRSSVGLGLERAMSPSQFHWRLPFYSRILGPSSVEARCVTQDVMDREIAYAREAGIDYWAFVWYPPTDGLSTARSLYLSSAHRDDVKWCVILGAGAFSEADRKWLAAQFLTPNYQKVLGGRPLVYVFDADSHHAELVRWLRDEAARARCATPFIVFMGWGPEVAKAAATCGADAVGAYVNPHADGSPFEANMANERGKWEALRATGLQVVPTVTTGWDPRPFLMNPVPWYHGASETNWVGPASPEQIAEQLTHALRFVRDHPDATLANTALIYAWNENAEGGWIVPTLHEMRDAGCPLRLDAVRSVLRPEAPRGKGWDLAR